MSAVMLILLVSGVALPWLLVGLGGWLVTQLVAQNGRLLLRIEAVEGRLGGLGVGPALGTAGPPIEPSAQGLPVGSVAPGFELPDLAGKTRSLAEFRGRRVLLIFFGPNCGYCLEMLPRLAVLGEGPVDGGPLTLVVSSGGAQENRRAFREHGVRCPVLLQKQLEVAALYKAYGTPVGYLIDEQGATASDLAVGSEAVLALAGAPTVPPTNGKKVGRGIPGGRPLSTSKLVRDGLKAGTPAPRFRLPAVDGRQIALDDFRGRRVLLVFSDPECGPCNELAPRLEDLHRRAADLRVVMVSRRDPESNRKKVAEYGLTFPVALQKNWDTSRDYGMFATPIAYLIDERGVIAADVASGADAILALAGPGSIGRASAANPMTEVCLDEGGGGDVAPNPGGRG